MFIKDWKKDLFTVPNMLSLFRLLLIPVYMVIYLGAEDMADHFIAAGILAVSCLTDMFDGKIARHFNMISTVGKVLDPLADKATQFSLIVCLALKYPPLLSLVCLFVVKESFQLIAGILALRNGKMLEGALISGKICTTVLFISLILMVLFPTLKPLYVHIIIIVDGLVMLIAFIDYARVYYTQSPRIQSIAKNEETKEEADEE